MSSAGWGRHGIDLVEMRMPFPSYPEDLKPEPGSAREIGASPSSGDVVSTSAGFHDSHPNTLNLVCREVATGICRLFRSTISFSDIAQ